MPDPATPKSYRIRRGEPSRGGRGPSSRVGSESRSERQFPRIRPPKGTSVRSRRLRGDGRPSSAPEARSRVRCPSSSRGRSRRRSRPRSSASLAAGRHLIAEAGTGVGKSLAYLVPALESGLRVVVATATKALQEQLLRHDVPLAAAALGREVTVAVVKGRQNYLCRRQLHGFQPSLLPRRPRRAGLGGDAGLARRDRDRRPRRARARAVGRALGRARRRRRPLRGATLPVRLDAASPRRRASVRARPIS